MRGDLAWGIPRPRGDRGLRWAEGRASGRRDRWSLGFKGLEFRAYEESRVYKGFRVGFWVLFRAYEESRVYKGFRVGFV